MLPSFINYRENKILVKCRFIELWERFNVMQDYCGKHCQGKPGCWGIQTPNSLIKHLLLPVRGTLGVIGNYGSAYHN